MFLSPIIFMDRNRFKKILSVYRLENIMRCYICKEKSGDKTICEECLDKNVTCPECHQERNLKTDFPVCLKKLSTRQTYCRKCYVARTVQYHRDHNETIQCECGGSYKKRFYPVHKETKKHQKWIQ